MRPGELGIIILCITMLVVIAITQLPMSSEPEQVVEALVPTTLPVVETDGPVSTYAIYCVKCHGSPEVAYPEVKVHKRNEELKAKIREMAETRAMVALDDKEVEELFVLHNAMFDRRPYVWIDPAVTDAVAGEIIPGSQVRAGKTRANVEDRYFVLPRTDDRVVVTRGGESISVKK